MIYTTLQARILELLRKLRWVSLPHLKWLLHLEAGANTRQILKALRQLEAFREVYLDWGAYHLPGQKPDREMTDALWVMRKIVGTQRPDYALGKPPCKLCFQLEDGFYRVIPVPAGKEELTQLMAEQDAAPGDCLLYLLRSREQIPLFRPSRRTYLVLPNEAHICVFLQPKE